MSEHKIEVDLGGGRRANVPVDLPGNSHKQRAAGQAAQERPEKNTEKVVTGKVVTRKKGLFKNFREAFVGDASPDGVLETIVTDILVAAFKSMISDAVSQGSDAIKQGFDRYLYGETARSRIRTSQYGRVNYSGVSTARRTQEYNTISRRGRARHDFDEIIMASRGEAEDVLDRMRELISQFEVATVADLYDLAGITYNFPDEEWGWTDLRHAMVRHVRGGYMISLPKAQPLD